MPTTQQKEPMTNKITQKIVAYKVLTPEQKDERDNPVEEIKIPTVMNETIKREPKLFGSTTRLKIPNEEHRLYITINDQVIEGVRYPREMFLTTKNPEHKMWMDALSLVISAVFRKGNDISFLVDEFSSVFDPKGGYFSKNRLTGKGKYYNSIVHEIGNVLEEHLKSISDSNLEISNSNSDFKLSFPSSDSKLPSVSVKEVIKSITELQPTEGLIEYSDFTPPPNATLCKECSYKAVVVLDGCPTCTQCGASKCG